jgi:hypothetical protein
MDTAGNAGAWSSSGVRRYVNVGRFDKDFNGDDYTDAMVGAFNCSSGRGRAYIYDSRISMNEIADVAITVEASAALGVSVASTGDEGGNDRSACPLGMVAAALFSAVRAGNGTGCGTGYRFDIDDGVAVLWTGSLSLRG